MTVPRPAAVARLLRLLALPLAAACDGDAQAAASVRAPSAPSRVEARPVYVLADTATVDAPLVLPTQLHVEHDAVVAARASGVIEALPADLGMHVGAGEMLAALDRGEQELAVARAEAASEGAERALVRLRQLVRANAGTPVDVEDAELRARDAAITLRKTRRDLALTRVVAPFAGTVTGRYVRPGRLVAVGDTLFRVTEAGPLLARVRVPEGAADAIRLGAAATVETPTGVSAAARVIRLAPVVDAASGTRELVLAVASAPRLLPGATARVRLGDDRRHVVVVPRAVVGEDGQVLVFEGGRPTLRAITLGADVGGGRVEVVSGLVVGERVARPDR